MSGTPGHRLTWRLRVMMAEKNIASATELQRRLEKSGYKVTSSQLTRIIKERPERISTDLLDHLLAVLGCHIEDLFRSDVVPSGGSATDNPSASNEATARPKKLRVRREPVAVVPGDDLTGPKVTAFPIPDRKK